MDLLLHLVHQKEVPVEQVEMREICAQYLEIISHAAVLDLERATEYLVVAATLISLKSQSLLPNGGLDGEAGGEDWFDSRFYENLRERLKAYELTKQRAFELQQRAQLGIDTFGRRPGASAELADEFIVAEEESQWIGDLFTGLMRRVGELGRKFIVRLEPVSVVSLMMKFVDQLKLRGRSPHSFLGLIGTVSGMRHSASGFRAQIISGFIAALELTKRGLVQLDEGRGRNDFSLRLHLAPAELALEEGDRVVDLDSYREAAGAESRAAKVEVAGV
jgi:segregation and condensation protein A